MSDMSDRSAIEWTDATWNPVRGCTKVSPGCKFCYAETFAERWRGTPNHPYEYGFDPRLVPHKMYDPLTWAKPRKIFVNSMSDLFHESVPDEYIRQVFDVMHAADWHIYQVLTKRAERMMRLSKTLLSEICHKSHIWLGVSVEDRKYGLPRIDLLRRTKARVRFLSIEPLLEDLGKLNLRKIDWVIVGGESGRRPRPMDPAWVRAIRDQCQRDRVEFFFKQWGGRNKKSAGRHLDDELHDGFPRVSAASMPDRDERLRRLRVLAA